MGVLGHQQNGLCLTRIWVDDDNLDFLLVRRGWEQLRGERYGCHFGNRLQKG
jgi:hypothetical protein